jgi:transposase
MLRYEGYDNQTIAERVGISKTRVVHLVGEYFRNGLEEYIRKKFGGNHRNMSVEEEEEILQQFRERAEAGQVVIAQEIKQAFDEKLGRDTGRGYIYMLLARHNWRKVMPRSRHPKKADDETIEATKKLTAE